MTITVVRKGTMYGREVEGQGGGVVTEKTPEAGLIIQGNGFVSWRTMAEYAVLANQLELEAERKKRRAKRAVRTRR